MIIEWSKKSEITYYEIIYYLQENWTKREIKKFNDKVFKSMEMLLFDPYIYPSIESYSNIRKMKITKQNSLFFSIKENVIFLIFFWNEYRNPEALKELFNSY